MNTGDSLRIVFLTTSLGLGGADRQILDIAQRLQDRGHSTYLLSLTPLGRMGEQAKDKGLIVHSLDMKRGVPCPRRILKALGLLRLWNPHILHSHLVHAILLGRFLRAISKVPVHISSAHNTVGKLGWQHLAYRLTERCTDLTTNVSQQATEQFLQLGLAPSKKLRVVSNGIDLSQFKFSAPARQDMRKSLKIREEFAWVAIGRLEVQKDYDTLLHAFCRIIEQEEESRLIVVGTGSEGERLTRLTNELGLKESVSFVGPTDAVSAYLSAADGFVLSSAWEGFGLVVAEALAAERPVVSTACAGPVEILNKGEFGHLVPPRSPNDLAIEMLRVMKTPEHKRLEMARRGRDFVEERFNINTTVDTWESIYFELLAASTVK